MTTLKGLGDSLNGAKWFLPLIPMLVAGLIGWGALKSEHSTFRRELDQKAEQRVVDAQYLALIREIQALREDLRLRRVP